MLLQLSPLRLSLLIALQWIFILVPAVKDDQLAVHTSDLFDVDSASPLSLLNPEVKVGDRLFFETRFAKFVFTHSGEINKPLSPGDPVVDEIVDAQGQSLPGPFRGQSMSCRQCHLGDDFIKEHPLKGRSYCDFSRRSAIPVGHGGRLTTVRNSPLMPDLELARDVPVLFHFDGEFSTVEDLVIETLTGENFGWEPSERNIAASHIARVIREDAGINARFVVDERGRGIPYSVVLLGTNPELPEELRIPHQFRIDVKSATDEEILHVLGKLIHAYMNSLRFGTDHTLRTSRSPYDLFLKKNALPEAPKAGESAASYSTRLVKMVNDIKVFAWVSPNDDVFRLHAQTYEFGPLELVGLKMFFNQGGSVSKHAGNCVTCHPPPQFTDHKFHNTGASQLEYDSVFGLGSFAALKIPALADRKTNFDAYLPPTAKHPNATARFRDIPHTKRPGHVDLGLWNVLGNPDLPKPQKALLRVLCAQFSVGRDRCTSDRLLPCTIAYFKTPSIRDLGQSSPYLHTGSLDTIEDVIRFYIATSKMARKGDLRNASPELRAVNIDLTDLQPLESFLRSLNEDYH